MLTDSEGIVSAILPMISSQTGVMNMRILKNFNPLAKVMVITNMTKKKRINLPPPPEKKHFFYDNLLWPNKL